MKFDQKTIVTLLIGIVIGGVAMGLIDANRPKPLFSSADGGSSGNTGMYQCYELWQLGAPESQLSMCVVHNGIRAKDAQSFINTFQYWNQPSQLE